MRRALRRLPALLTVALLCASGAVRSQPAGSPVVGMLRSATDPRVRTQAALSLARVSAPDGPAALRDALSDRSAMVRAAAASTLAALGDVGSVPALRARSSDPDANVRDAVSHALTRLDRAAPASEASSAPTADLARVRFLVRPGELTDAAHDPARPAMVRDAIGVALRDQGDVALLPGALPAMLQRRVRSGAARVFALDGGVQSVRRVGAPGAERLRAEVNLVIVSDAHHNIVGMVTGAASAPVPSGSTADDRRLEAMLVEGAVRAALRDVSSALASAP